VSPQAELLRRCEQQLEERAYDDDDDDDDPDVEVRA
jgi:hypothetical protein